MTVRSARSSGRFVRRKRLAGWTSHQGCACVAAEVAEGVCRLGGIARERDAAARAGYVACPPRRNVAPSSAFRTAIPLREAADASSTPPVGFRNQQLCPGRRQKDDRQHMPEMNGCAESASEGIRSVTSPTGDPGRVTGRADRAGPALPGHAAGGTIERQSRTKRRSLRRLPRAEPSDRNTEPAEQSHCASCTSQHLKGRRLPYRDCDQKKHDPGDDHKDR